MLECNFFALILVSVLGNAQSYQNTSSGLARFPGDIPANDVIIDVSDNEIVSVDAEDLRHFGQLEELIVSGNLLTEFPDVRPVAATIKIIRVNNNKIKSMHPEYLTSVKHLEILDLTKNQLDLFPNLGDAQQSLRSLILGQNIFTTVPMDSFIHFRNLDFLDISFNEMATLPNSCNASFWERISLLGGAEQLRCDCLMRYMLIRPNEAFKNWICQAPPNYRGYSLWKFKDPNKYFICPGMVNPKLKQTSFTLVQNNFYCHFPYVIKRHYAESVAECANFCLERQYCYYFNYNVNRRLCDVTDIEATAEVYTESDNSGWEYYSIA